MKSKGVAVTDRLPDPMSFESVRNIRLNGVEDRAKNWVITDDMNVEAYRKPTPEEKRQARAAKVAKVVEEVTANAAAEVTKPSTRGKRKLTEDDVLQIRKRAAEGVPNKISAEDFNVTTTCIYNIVRRNTWKHVE